MGKNKAGGRGRAHRDGIPGKPLEEVTFDQRGPKEVSKQAPDGRHGDGEEA